MNLSTYQLVPPYTGLAVSENASRDARDQVIQKGLKLGKHLVLLRVGRKHLAVKQTLVLGGGVTGGLRIPILLRAAVVLLKRTTGLPSWVVRRSEYNELVSGTDEAKKDWNSGSERRRKKNWNTVLKLRQKRMNV